MPHAFALTTPQEGWPSVRATAESAPCYSQKFMPTEHIVALLIAERDKLNRAIEALQGSMKRRGRAPKNPLVAAATSSPAVTPASTKKRKRQSAAQRKAQGKRMKAYWAAKRKTTKG